MPVIVGHLARGRWSASLTARSAASKRERRARRPLPAPLSNPCEDGKRLSRRAQLVLFVQMVRVVSRRRWAALAKPPGPGPERGPRLSRSDPRSEALEPRTWLYRAESAASGTTTEPKVRGSNPLGRVENPLETAGFRLDRGVPKKVPNFASSWAFGSVVVLGQQFDSRRFAVGVGAARGPDTLGRRPGREVLVDANVRFE